MAKFGRREELTDIIANEGPRPFSRERVSSVENLFFQRSALFYTPTENIPPKWIGGGSLDTVLPIPIPSYYEFFEIYGYRTPRLWVDLLQRATGKLRWRPNIPASLVIIRYDCNKLADCSITGAKALVDALKVKTFGRSDGRLLYYFGAIYDDGDKYISELRFKQEIVASPADARTRIIIKPGIKRKSPSGHGVPIN
jgi:hypothetical protein